MKIKIKKLKKGDNVSKLLDLDFTIGGYPTEGYVFYSPVLSFAVFIPEKEIDRLGQKEEIVCSILGLRNDT